MAKPNAATPLATHHRCNSCGGCVGQDGICPTHPNALVLSVVAPRRAPKGTMDADATLLLKMPRALRHQLDAAAARAGLSSAEWVRRAIAAGLKPARSRGPG